MLFPSNGGGRCTFVGPLPSIATSAVPLLHSVVEPAKGIKAGAVTLNGLGPGFPKSSVLDGSGLQVRVASFPGPSTGGERAWYTLRAHAPGSS